MFEANDMVMHPTAGVCKIECIQKENIARTGLKNYYILKPVYGNTATTLYVPTDSDKIKLRKVLSTSEIKALIHSVSPKPDLWIDNDARRKEAFTQILRSQDHKAIIEMIIAIKEKWDEKLARNRKLHAADERILREAEKMIHQEFAYALNIQVNEVLPYIMQELS
jgi:CarD family transcriptional regulator